MTHWDNIQKRNLLKAYRELYIIAWNKDKIEEILDISIRSKKKIIIGTWKSEIILILKSMRELEDTAKITSFSECIFRVYLIQWWNQKISLYLVWKSIICSSKSLLNYPYIYFLKGEIHVLNLNRISVIRIDSLLILCISKLIYIDKNKIYNFHLLTSSRLSAARDKNNNECFILCNPGLQKE